MLRSMGSQRVGYDLVTEHQSCVLCLQAVILRKLKAVKVLTFLFIQNSFSSMKLAAQE